MNSASIKAFFVVVFCWGASTSFSQNRPTPSPGGVAGAIRWWMADSSNAERLNFHPARRLTTSNGLSISLGKAKLPSTTFFTVYQTKERQKDQLIWSIDKNQKTSLVLTNERMADLEAMRYMNFTDLAPTMPKIAIYGQFKSVDSSEVAEQTWNIGNLPTYPELPVSVFNGLVPELIAFNRVLDREERLKVASYLELKYGITLTESSGKYVNSLGKTLWNGEESPIFHHNIAGIGRDDASGWWQKIASSSHSPNLLTISTPSPLDNHQYLLWGDNDQAFVSAPKTIGMPTFLKRKGLVSSLGKNLWETEVVWDTKQVFAAIPPNPVFWLAVDTTATGEFAPLTTCFFKMKNLDKQGLAYFNTTWKMNKSQKNHFSFVVAQDLLVTTKVTTPSCSQPDFGQFQVRILGGQPPYSLTIFNKSTGFVAHRQQSETLSTAQFGGLFAGHYVLNVTDALQQMYVDSFWVNPAEAPLPLGLSDTYYLVEGAAPVRVNAAENMPAGITYRWRSPDKIESQSPEIELNQQGVYTLITTQNGCSSTREIQVDGPQISVFHSEIVYPNPSSGRFTIKVRLHQPAPVHVSIFSAEGKQVLTDEAFGADQYLFSEQLTTHGLYLIVLQSGTSVTTHKLFIVR